MKISDADKIMAGASEVANVYLGSEEVWAAGGGIPSGRYVKVDIASNWGDAYCGTVIIWACDADGNKLNNETMPHTAGQNPFNDAQNASDVFSYTQWEFESKYVPTWWKVDLGEVRDIPIMKIQGPPGQPNQTMKDFTVSFSDDDSNWTVVLSAQMPHNTVLQTFNL